MEEIVIKICCNKLDKTGLKCCKGRVGLLVLFFLQGSLDAALTKSDVKGERGRLC